jgi:hypothetical protein
MPFQYTFRSDDITTWDVDTRDLVENRDRELELFTSTLDDSLLNLNASNLTLGTVPSSRVTGSYTGITQVGTLSAGVASYSIGDTGPAGGKVFITPSTPGNTTGLYFEVALISAEVERTWAQFAPINYTSTSVFVSNNIGTGKANTVNIINQGNSNPDTCAAKYCNDFTYGGFSDWVLPSLDELAQIYTNRVVIGNNFAGKSYYSSSAYDDARAYWLDGSTGNQNYGSKSTALFVRPVRSFSATGLNVLGSAVVRTAATQDGVNLTGRAGGTSDYVVNILPTTLTASQTVTLPDATGTVITTGNLSSITSVGTLTGLASSGQITVNRGSLGTLAFNFLTAINAYAETSDGDSLLTRIRRINNGSTWQTAAWRISRQVGSTNMGFVQFGDGAGGQFVQFGVDNTVYGYVGTAGFFGVGTNLTSLNASNLSSGTVASARLSGAYTGITGVGTLTGLTIGGAGANRFITINAPTGFYAIQYFQINGVFKWHYEVNPAGDRWSLVQTGVAERIGVDSARLAFDGAGSPSIQMGDWSSDSSYSAIQTSRGYLLLGRASADDGIFLRSSGAGAIHIGAGGQNALIVGSSSIIVSGNYQGGISYGSYGSVSMGGALNGWAGISFPDTTSAMMVQNTYFGHYRNNNTWNFYVNNGTFVPSDERYKRDIQPLEHGLNFIREITPVSYDPLTESLDDDPETTVGKTHYGFTTQNIIEALTNAGETRNVAIVDIGGPSTEETNSDRQYLNYSALMAPMVKAIQELDQRLQQLETA